MTERTTTAHTRAREGGGKRETTAHTRAREGGGKRETPALLAHAECRRRQIESLLDFFKNRGRAPSESRRRNVEIPGKSAPGRSKLLRGTQHVRGYGAPLKLLREVHVEEDVRSCLRPPRRVALARAKPSKNAPQPKIST